MRYLLTSSVTLFLAAPVLAEAAIQTRPAIQETSTIQLCPSSQHFLHDKGIELDHFSAVSSDHNRGNLTSESYAITASNHNEVVGKA
ncbi:hypothetical protein NS337_00520 [Pseudomonas oryzihabitans]|uniref:hypothetical protein n=1 Tax=Pseudomonas oryzihabitans TaxID=47885 RepID=UPI000736B46E|nr:hypothetical protein [Pseudomonas psychrotolerans]KTT57161.1 hypothetical protein NS337_00520 [Pseudomonas psychrotolerans]